MTVAMSARLSNNIRWLRRIRGAGLLAVGFLLLAGSLQAGTATVFAAASLKPVLDELEAQFEAQTGHDLTIAYAGTSVLARQIQQGAPADMFISANVAWMDALDDEGLIADGTPSVLASNRLVLIAAEKTDATLAEALSGDGSVAMAFVDAIPAGIYGRSALQTLGLWEDLAPRVIQTDNVRVALALVARGDVRLGIVYRSDALSEPENVVVVDVFDESLHDEILYLAALLAGEHSEAADAFLTFLKGPEAQEAFVAAGFSVVSDGQGT